MTGRHCLSRWAVPWLLLVACACTGSAAAALRGGRVQSWSQLVDAAKRSKRLAGARASLVAEARRIAETPVVRRAFRLEDVGKHRTWLNGRTRDLEPEIAETFALAMSDYGACSTVAAELPVLAAAFRLTGERRFRDRAVEQLAEMAEWSPLQRPGWTCYMPGRRLPPDGKDGNWLATGMGVRAIADALELLPPRSVPASLRRKLEALLAAEIAGVVDDWRTRRSWFIRSNNAVTNQWVLPTEGLVRACLVLGRARHEEAYELGVRNLLQALDVHGMAGEFEEGIGYAAFTVTSMVHTARAMALAGDSRALDHLFLRHFPTWLVHHLQPGHMVINAFDAGFARGDGVGLRPLLSLLAVCTQSTVARWALTHCLGGPSNDLAGLAAHGLDPVGADAAPPLFAAYERAARVNWRDSWDDDANGVWVRGGHALDQHDHQDRGHVNYVARGRPILIEAGTPSYENVRLISHYSSAAGHNVLQIGTTPPTVPAHPQGFVIPPGWQKPGGIAPIALHRLDRAGGDVTVDGTRCYDGLREWRRRVTWSAAELLVTDEVRLAGAEVVLFRWHLGTGADAAASGDGAAHEVAWPEARMTLEGSAPLVVTREKMPDHTLDSRQQEHPHTCIVVRSREAVSRLRLVTRVRPR